MPESRQSERIPSRRYRGLWGTSQEIARSVDAILRSVHKLPVEMRDGTLRVARELLVAQSYVVDRLSRLPEPSVGDEPKAGSQVDQVVPQALAPPTRATHHQPVSAWLDQNASRPTAAMLDKGSGRTLKTTDGQWQPIETFRSFEGHHVPNEISPAIESEFASPATAKAKTGLKLVAPLIVVTSLVFWLCVSWCAKGRPINWRSIRRHAREADRRQHCDCRANRQS